MPNSNRDAKTGQYAITHGAKSPRTLLPLQEQKVIEIEEMICGTRTMVAPSDRIAINLLARNLAKIELFDRYLDDNGIFTRDKDGIEVPQPLLKVYWQALNSAARLCAALGLTTDARLRLGLQTIQNEDALSRIQQAKKKKIGKDEVV